MSFFGEYKAVNELLKQKQQVIFYAESKHYFTYYERLIKDLLATGQVSICYITSDAKDPLLEHPLPGMKVIYVKWMLGFLFSRLRTDVMIMTMPDLGNYLFKRSTGVGCYIYVFHAAVSTHQQYRQEAFFNYDCIFCTGEYQEKEIREAERIHELKQKDLVHYGYPLFDEMKQRSHEKKSNEKTILVAPSWFEGCIFDTCIEELIKQLASQTGKVILRSHPEYEKRKKKEFRNLKKLVSGYPNMAIDEMSSILDRLPMVDMLITDRSGIALEFAFGVGKPVLFIYTKPKQTNPEWRELKLEPIENAIRGEIGVSLLPSAMQNLNAAIHELDEMSGGFSSRMEIQEKLLFYNSEKNYRNGVEYVLDKLK